VRGSFVPWSAALLLLLACSPSNGSDVDSGKGTVGSCSSCSPSQVCMTVLGGQPTGCAVIPNPDAGCPAGMVMDGTYCVAVAYQCVSTPAGCDSGAGCACSLCPCDGGACTVTSTGVTCNCLGP
jgi:hypothetical protein